MSNFCEVITLEFLAGTDIGIATEEAILYAKENHCIVKVEFNGIPFKIYYFSDVKEICNRYFSELNKKLFNRY